MMMIKSTLIGILVACVSTVGAAAATITAKLCNKDCLELSSYPAVELTLSGHVEKGDLANLQTQYAAPAQFACLNRIEPGRYVIMTPNEYNAWKKSHPPQASDANQSTRNSEAETQCLKGVISNQPGHVNGMLLIDSGGGDLEEAMAIGQWVRQQRLGVTARGNCASACIWVLASGLIRDIWTGIGTTLWIHRPFLTTNEPQAGGRLRALLQQSKAYFDQMGVPSDLAERMFSTPPDEAKRLTPEQISYYRLNQNEMGFEEELDFVRAKNLGISREEYTKRMQIYNAWNARSPCPFESMAQKDTSAYLECLNERARKVGIQQ